MALTAERRIREERWSRQTYTLTGAKAWKGGIAMYDQSLGKVVPASTAAGSVDHFPLGLFNETVDATAGDKPVVVNHFYEVAVRWFKNDGTNPVTVNDIGKDVYAVDDNTVSILNTNRSKLGIARAIDTVRGVAVEVK